MKVLLITKLPNHTLHENILSPLLASSYIDHIYVLRDFEGTTVDDRVTYLNPEKKSSSKIRHIKKVVNGVDYCKKYDIDVIIGVLIYPHGYIGQAISFFTKKPYIHVTIAGHREYWMHGKLVEKLNISLFKRSRFITITGKQTETYLLKKNVNPKQVVILPNLPNSIFLSVDNNPETDRKYDIISFSRIDKNKNVALLMRALVKVKEVYPQVRVFVGGNGSEFDNVKQLSIDLGLKDNVYFAGFVSEKPDIIKAYSDSRIFISCSRGEGFPVSLIEAMACGCVPVVSNVGDIVDVVDADNGRVFNDTENEAELTEILIELLTTKGLLPKMSAKAMNIKNTISVENNAKIWDSMFKAISSSK